MPVVPLHVKGNTGQKVLIDEFHFFAVFFAPADKNPVYSLDFTVISVKKLSGSPDVGNAFSGFVQTADQRHKKRQTDHADKWAVAFDFVAFRRSKTVSAQVLYHILLIADAVSVHAFEVFQSGVFFPRCDDDPEIFQSGKSVDFVRQNAAHACSHFVQTVCKNDVFRRLRLPAEFAVKGIENLRVTACQAFRAEAVAADAPKEEGRADVSIPPVGSFGIARQRHIKRHNTASVSVKRAKKPSPAFG